MASTGTPFSFHAELLDLAEQAVIATDAAGSITYWNRRAEEMYGWRQEEVIGRKIDVIVPPVSRDEAARMLEALGRGETWAGPFLMRHRDGKEFPVHAMVAPLRREGEVVGMVGFSTVAAGASNAERRHRALLRAAPDPIFRISRTGRFLEYTGPAGARLVAGADFFLGRHMSDVLPAAVTAECQEAIERAIGSESVVTLEYTLPLDGSDRLFEARIAPCGRDEVIAIVRDITSARRFQDELHARVTERTEEIARLSRRLVAMQEEEWQRIGRELHDEVGQVVTALSMIIAAARNDPPRAQALLDDTAELLRRLRDSVHTLSRDLVAPLQDTDIVAALRSHIDGFARRTGLPIEFTADDVNGLNDAVAVAIFRIVQEALTNVVRHARASHAMVHVEVADALHIEVADDGEGFDDDRASRGAGMWGMRQRALLVGGQLTIETAAGAGTRVLLRLPLEGSAR